MDVGALLIKLLGFLPGIFHIVISGAAFLWSSYCKWNYMYFINVCMYTYTYTYN